MEEEEVCQTERTPLLLFAQRLLGSEKEVRKDKEKGEAMIKMWEVKHKFTAAVNFILYVPLFFSRGP